MSSVPSLLRKAYYRAKPFMPDRVRMKIRRSYAQKLRKKHAHVWPIDDSAGEHPTGWGGWPDGKEFAFVLTHDVEGNSGLARVRQLAQLEIDRGVKASYNFVPEGEYRVPDKLLNWLRDEGFEIGVHDLHHDGFLYETRNGFLEKAKRINQYLKEWGAVGFRSAFMLRNLIWIHDLEIDYDSSTFDTDPFEPQPEGAGTIFPFFVNGVEGRHYVELPYTLAQDSSLFLIFEERDPSIWMRKLDWIVERGGMALMNIHPDYIRFEDEPEIAYTYEVEQLKTFLDYLEGKYGGRYWNPTAAELAKWFRSQRRD